MFKKLISLLLVSTMLLCALSASADGISGTFSGKGTGYWRKAATAPPMKSVRILSFWLPVDTERTALC